MAARRGEAPCQLGQTLTVEHAGETRHVKLPLIGAYQTANALVSAALALTTDAPVSAVFDALGRLQPVRGRLERACLTPKGAPVYVDYAHTPDALEAAMVALRPHVETESAGKLLVVFGAGGAGWQRGSATACLSSSVPKRCPIGRGHASAC